MASKDISSVDFAVAPIILNGSMVINNGFNNTYRYVFPKNGISLKDAKIALGSINIYYSWANITAANNNNSYQIIFPVGASTQTFTLTMPDGFYQVTDLNSYLQSFCISNGLYLINSSGQYVYYLEWVENSSYYSIQLNAYSVPTSLPSGWSAPSNWVGYPTTDYTPQVVILNNNFTSIVGFNAGTYPSTQQTTTYSKLSSFTPEITPIQSLVLTCSLLNNEVSYPTTALYLFGPGNTSYGSLIQSSPNEYFFVNCFDGSYQYMDISILDQNFNPVTIKDTNIIITLLLMIKK